MEPTNIMLPKRTHTDIGAGQQYQRKRYVYEDIHKSLHYVTSVFTYPAVPGAPVVPPEDFGRDFHLQGERKKKKKREINSKYMTAPSNRKPLENPPHIPRKK